MIGRATFGRPWIFKEIMDVLNPESVSVAHEAVKSGYPVMSADWKIDVLKEQVLTSVRRIDEYRGILHSPVEARPDELAQIRAAAAAENLRQICRGASPSLHHHREGGEDFRIFLFEIFAFQLAPIGGNESTVGLVVQICLDFPGSCRSLRPKVIFRGLLG